MGFYVKAYLVDDKIFVSMISELFSTGFIMAKQNLKDNVVSVCALVNCSMLETRMNITSTFCKIFHHCY